MGRLIIAIILLSSLSFATGGSNYSAFGLGDLKYSNGAAYDGQGGASAAMPSDLHVNLRNPALWSKTTQTILQFGYNFDQGFTQVGNETNYQTNGSINSFLLQFTLDTASGLSAGMGLFKSSNVAYRVASRFAEEVEGLFTSGQLLQIGEGSLNTAYIGGSVSPLKNLSFGIMATYHFGTINDSLATLFDQNVNITNRTTSSSENQFTGFNLRAGLYYEPIRNLSIGAFIETQGNLEVDQVTRFSSDGLQNADSNNIIDPDPRNVTLPQLFGGGISYKIDRFRIGADFWTRDFTGFDLNRRRDDKVTFTNANGFNFGFHRKRSTKVGATFLDKLTFRAGLGYSTMYYQVGDNQINESFISGGVTSKIGNKALFDYSVMIGTRGENTSPLFGETFIRMNFNISILETWFVPFRRGYDDLEN